MMDLQRLDIRNALYYVELKSNGHRPLFAERSGFSAFIDLLADLEIHTSSKVIAYCLLQDTVYLVIQNGEKPLQTTTRYITEQYTLFAQKEWNHHGSLFNKHHHCLLLEPSRYLLPCIQYVHHQPVSMGLVAEASIYPWSSLQSYIGEASQVWLHTPALQQFTGLATVRRNTHLECLTQPPTQTLNLQQGNHAEVWALAGDAFVQRLLQRHRKNITAPTVEWLTQQLCDRHQITHSDLNLRHGHRRYLEIRAEIAALTVEFSEQITTSSTPNLEEASDDQQDTRSRADIAITQELKRAIEDHLETSMELLAPQILTLRETRAHYLHGLYLDLRRQWQQLETLDTTNQTASSVTEHSSDEPKTTEERSQETSDSTIEESSSVGD